MEKTNENREDTEIKSEDEETKEEDFNVDKSAEGEEEGKEDEGEDTKEDDKKEEDGKELEAKFKGKSVDDVVKMYKNLESTIDKRALIKAQELLNGGLTKKEAKEQADEIEKEIEKLDFTKMDPKAFALSMLRIMEGRSLRIAEQTFSQNSERKDMVKREISDAQKQYPQLKDNEAFRDLVLAVIESNTKQGKNVSLKDACAKVAALGGGTEEKKEEQKPKVNPTLESQEGANGGKEKETEEDKMIKGIVGGNNANPFMKGLF